MGAPYVSWTGDQVGRGMEGARAVAERVEDIAREGVSRGFHFVPPFGTPRKRFCGDGTIQDSLSPVLLPPKAFEHQAI